jgi:hypothetical protein
MTITLVLLTIILHHYDNHPGFINNHIMQLFTTALVLLTIVYAVITIALDLLTIILHCYHNFPKFIDNDITPL